jgi:hypothetical protein
MSTTDLLSSWGTVMIVGILGIARIDTGTWMGYAETRRDRPTYLAREGVRDGTIRRRLREFEAS